MAPASVGQLDLWQEEVVQLQENTRKSQQKCTTGWILVLKNVQLSLKVAFVRDLM